MSRSRKRTPVTCWVCCKSQKQGKRLCNKKFRRCEHVAIQSGQFEKVPYLTRAVMSPWDLGGDGKHYWLASPTEEWLVKLMRK